MSFKPLEEVGLQGGAGRLRKRAVSSAILVTRRLLMSVHTRARNAVSSTRLAMSRLRHGNRCGFSRRLRCDGSSAVGAGPRPEHLTAGLPGWASFFVSSALAIGFIGFRDYRSVSEGNDGNIDILK